MEIGDDSARHKLGDGRPNGLRAVIAAEQFAWAPTGQIRKFVNVFNRRRRAGAENPLSYNAAQATNGESVYVCYRTEACVGGDHTSSCRFRIE